MTAQTIRHRHTHRYDPLELLVIATGVLLVVTVSFVF